MQNFASFQTRGMPVGAPIPRITSAKSDILTSSNTQAARLPSRRVSSRSTVPRQVVATNYFVNATGVALPECSIGNSSNSSLVSRKSEGLKERVTSQLIPCLQKSVDNEQDLAAMVNDFMENGSHDLDFHEINNDQEKSATPDSKPSSEALQALIINTTLFEKELLSVIPMITLSIYDKDLACSTPTNTNCKGGCIRRSLVKHLQLMKYNAAVCSSKWPSSGRVPGGEYEYIDVIVADNASEKGGRLIVDVDFQSQFEIARPTQSYLAALRCVPVLFIGSTEKLSQVLQVLAEATKLSMKQNAMLVPPWRTLSYMTSKWMSPFERLNVKADEGSSTCGRGQHTQSTQQCRQQLHRLKVCMSAEVEKRITGRCSSLPKINSIIHPKLLQMSYY